jgi:ADP-dependent NAD(P)H-hydrate dehydratase / NAD(P)H-hydrate epimerase
VINKAWNISGIQRMQPTILYTAKQCRDLDFFATESGIAGYALMSRAGRAGFDLLCKQWPGTEPVHVICGLGNNGGDGLVVARLAHLQGRDVTVHLSGDAKKFQDEAECAYVDAQIQGVRIIPVDTTRIITKGIIVDALLGIGLQGPVRDSAAEVIRWINACHRPVLALDIPSGLCADTGNVLGDAVKAEKTLTFIAAKRGLYTAKGVEYCGEVILDSLAVPQKLYAMAGTGVEHLQLPSLLDVLPVRPLDAHKGLFGHVLVIGGNKGMAGAVLMAAEACARTGAGLVSVATLPEHVPAIVSHRPELMAHGVNSIHDLEPLLARATVVVIGPGLGQDAWAEQMLYRAATSGLPMVVDADALNIISGKRVINAPYPAQWILTPHPGEAARLLDVRVSDVNADRFASVQKLQKQYGATVILKGAGTLIASEQAMALCSYGNPGMASGGMGDVLSGVTGGLLAQGLSTSDAARLAVALHAKAADLAVLKSGMRGLLASDLMPMVRQLMNAIECQ